MSILAYLYLLATLHLTSSRGHVEELQHTLTLKHAVSAIPMRRLEEKPLVALILRGQAFRFGQQLQMKTHTRPQPQAHALASVVNNLVVPLEEVLVRLLLGLPIPDHLRLQLGEELDHLRDRVGRHLVGGGGD